VRRAILALTLAGLAALPAQHAAAAQPCANVPRPDRWNAATTPDRGREDPTIAAHRGAAELAPENTLDAYRYAIAYGVDLIEVDVQQTLDGRFVAFHDPEVDAKTDGTGRIGLMTYAQVRALNAADNDKWRGSEFDPARIPSLEEVLQLARATGVGLYVDMKESVLDVPGMMRVFGAFPEVTARSAFLPYEPARAVAITAVAPAAQLMWSNLDPAFPAASLYMLGERYTWFGSDLETYDAGKIVAVHDACALVIPNVYDGADADAETRNLHAARAMGADGAQINLPDVTADALDEPVATALARAAGQACLREAAHGIGLPRKPLLVGSATSVTGRHGCVAAPGHAPVRFAGDGSALPSEIAPGLPASTR
jgi:glycerophosphoryl diester phosphodiesterase